MTTEREPLTDAAAFSLMDAEPWTPTEAQRRSWDVNDTKLWAFRVGEKAARAESAQEIAELRAERDALAAAMPSEGADAALAYAAMKTERDALRADAQRYRWLRDEESAHIIEMLVAPGLHRNQVDAAIDAAKGADATPDKSEAGR